MSDAAASISAPESAPISAPESSDFGPGESESGADTSGDEIEAAIAAVRGAKPAEAPAAPAEVVPDAPGEPAAKSPKDDVPAVEKSPESDKPKAAAWAELHKEKKALFAKEQSLKEKYAPLEKRIAEFEAAKDDKVAALKLLGYEDPKAFLEEIAETGGKLTPDRKIALQVQKELAELKAERAAEQAAKQKAEQQREYQQGVDNHLKNIDSVLKSNPKFQKSLIATVDGGKDAILEVMREHYAKTTDEATGQGEVMPYEKAAEVVENNYKKTLDNAWANEAIRAYLLSKQTDSKLPQKAAAAVSEMKPANVNKVVAPRVEEAGAEDKSMEEALTWLKRRQQASRSM